MRFQKPDVTGRSAEGPKHHRERSRKMRRSNSTPDDQSWGWIAQDMLESAAWLVCPDPARRAIMLVWAEHMRHAGQKNGELPVTWRDFLAAGIRQGGIALALAQAQALGFIRRTASGRRSYGADPGASQLWALTWLPIRDESQATNPWKALKTVEDAKEALSAASARAARAGASPLENIDSATAVGSGEMPAFRAMRAR